MVFTQSVTALALVALLPLSTSQDVSVSRATTADFAWLAGEWEGALPQGVAHVMFDHPSGGIITGVMHLVSPENKVLVVELISLVDSPSGVQLRFRHFSSELSAYESDFQQTMLLTTHAAGSDVFENQVPFSKALMSTQPRTTTFFKNADGSWRGRTELLDTDGKSSVIESTYRRARSGR
jgi:hypothetical protein